MFAVPALLLCVSGHASAQDVIISEIMFNPDGDENAREFVEIMNRSEADISIEGWMAGDGAAWDEIIPAADRRHPSDHRAQSLRGPDYHLL